MPKKSKLRKIIEKYKSDMENCVIAKKNMEMQLTNLKEIIKTLERADKGEEGELDGFKS